MHRQGLVDTSDADEVKHRSLTYADEVWRAKVPGAMGHVIATDAPTDTVLISDGWGIAYAALRLHRISLSTGNETASVRTRHQAVDHRPCPPITSAVSANGVWGVVADASSGGHAAGLAKDRHIRVRPGCRRAGQLSFVSAMPSAFRRSRGRSAVVCHRPSRDSNRTSRRCNRVWSLTSSRRRRVVDYSG